MAKGWTKDADWLDLAHARAQVKFYEKDLQYSLKYLAYVKTFSKKGWKGYPKQLKIAEKDVADSKRNLEKAIVKLEESKRLE